MKRIWPVMLFSALAACEPPAAAREEMTIESRSAQTTADSATVSASADGIAVEGVYRAPGTAYRLRAEYDRSGDGVTVIVRGYLPANGATHPAITGIGYRIVAPVPAGTYTVRVVHHDQGSGNPNPRDVTTAPVTVTR